MNEELKVIISAETAKLRKELDKAQKEVEKLKQKGKVSFQEFNEELQKVGGGAKKALSVMAGAITGAATAILALGASTQEYRQQQAKLTTAFEAAGGSATEAKNTYNDLYRTLGDTDKATEAAAHLAKLTTNQSELSEWTNICQGIYATFGDSLPIEGLTEAANETAKVGTVTGGLADALNWAGVSEDAFNESLAACTTEQEREALIRETLNGLYSDASAKYEENNAQILAQNEANQKMTDSLAKVGEAVAPINTALTELAADVLTQLEPYITQFAEEYLPQITEALSGVGDMIGKVITWIADNWEMITTIAGVIAAICAVLSVFSTVMGIVNAVMAASPVTWIVLGIVAAIAALVAIVILVIKYWDEVKAATIKCWNAIVEAVKTAVNWVIEFFKKIISWIVDNWQGLLLLILNPFVGAFKLVYDNCEGFRNIINNFIAKVKEVIGKGFNIVKEKIITPISSAFNKVRETFSKIFNTIKEKLNAAKEFVSGVIEKIKGFFSFKVELPKIKLPHFAIKPEGWELGDLLKGSIPSLGIDWYAKGGVFDKPTLFNYGNGQLGGLGEAGAEAIVPLENNTQWLDKIAAKLQKNQAPTYLMVDKTVLAQVVADGMNGITRSTGKIPINVI